MTANVQGLRRERLWQTASLGGNETLWAVRCSAWSGQHMSRYIALAGLSMALLLSDAPALADPKCAGPENWPASMTFAQLKNAGILVNDKVNFSRTSVRQIASQRIGKDLYKQVFEISFYLKDGKPIRAIVVSDASEEECSMSDVIVYRIADPTPE